MKVYHPDCFDDGEHLDRDRVEAAAVAVDSAVTVAKEKRMWRSFYTHDFGALTTGSSGETILHHMYANASPWEVTGIQLIVYAAEGVTVSATFASEDPSAGDGETIEVAGAGADTWASFERAVSVAAAENYDFTTTITTDGNADVRIAVNFRYRRWVGYESAAPLFAEGGAIVNNTPTNSLGQALYNAGASAVATLTDAAASKAPRFLSVRGPTGGTIDAGDTVHIPALADENIYAFGSVCVFSGSGTVTATLKDDAGATVATLTHTTGAGPNKSTTVTEAIGAALDLADSGDDYTVEWAITSGTPTITQSYINLTLE